MDVTRIHRLLRLITVLQSGREMTSAQLADSLGISRRTLFRDFAALRAAGIPCTRNANGYQIAPNFFLPPLNLKVTEALGLLLLGKTAEHHNTQPFFRPAAQAIEKLTAVLPAPYRQTTGQMMRHTSMAFGSTPAVPQDADFFVQLQQAIDQHRVCHIHYHSLYDADDIQTALHPFHLHFATRSWYVIGHSALHDQTRTFKLSRIYDLELTDRRFTPDNSFDIDKYLGLAWSLIPEGTVYDIHLEFSPKVGENVAEVQWHSTQQHHMLDDGRCRMSFRVDGLNEITWWLLGYGDHVRVLNPPQLRDRLARVHARAAQHCGQDTSDDSPQEPN